MNIDYLAEEVLGRLSDTLRTFLLQYSVLARFNAELCDAVTEVGQSKALLETLDRENLFLIPLDEYRQWYRFHHLFVDVLRVQLRQSERDTHVLHRRASVWLQRNEQMKEAIHHALLAEDYKQAAGMIENEWPKLRRVEPEATFNGWMRPRPRCPRVSLR